MRNEHYFLRVSFEFIVSIVDFIQNFKGMFMFKFPGFDLD